MYKRILAAIDTSSRADSVIETVEYLARITGASVHVLHAGESRIVYDQIVELESEADARATLNRALEKMRAAGVEADGEVLDVIHEDVPQTILDRAAALGSDLIVLGPRHHGRIGALLGSSVSHEVSLRTPVSLLLVA
jgi:nucleotide-binding universal stress UspA family protein